MFFSPLSNSLQKERRLRKEQEQSEREVSAGEAVAPQDARASGRISRKSMRASCGARGNGRRSVSGRLSSEVARPAGRLSVIANRGSQIAVSQMTVSS